MKYANIIVDISVEKLDKTFQYSIPENLQEEIQVGVQVDIPFGNRKLTGYVMELTEDAYVAFAAQNPENYTESLELEKRIEQFEREWEQQPEYRQLRLRGDWRVNDRVKYDAENERLTQALKNSYRTSVSV